MLTPFFAAILLAFLATFLVIKYARALGVVDDPQKRAHPATLHSLPVPRGGGIPVFVAIFTASLLFLPLDAKLLGILAGASLILAVGFLDDRKSTSWKFRLGANAVAAFFPVLAGITISFVTNPLGGVLNLALPISIILVVVWLVAVTNMVSWSSGVDGQLAGFIPIAAVTIGALSLRSTGDVAQWPVIILSLIVAGAYLGFLPWSVFPQRIMPGYSGGALAGYLLAVLAILSGAKVATAVIVLAIPVIDAGFTILRRLITKRSLFWADRGHLHHRLLAIGWTKPQVAAFYWTITSFLGFLVLHLNSQQKLYTLVMLTVLVGTLLLWLTKSETLLKQPGRPTG